MDESADSIIAFSFPALVEFTLKAQYMVDFLERHAVVLDYFLAGSRESERDLTRLHEVAFFVLFCMNQTNDI